MRPFLLQVVEALVERHGHTGRVDLNDVAEVIGDEAVSYDDVEAVYAALEGRGCQVGGEPTVREMELLRRVLAAGRALREAGDAATVDAIAAHCELPRFVVQRALENGKHLAR